MKEFWLGVLGGVVANAVTWVLATLLGLLLVAAAVRPLGNTGKSASASGRVTVPKTVTRESGAPRGVRVFEVESTFRFRATKAQ